MNIFCINDFETLCKPTAYKVPSIFNTQTSLNGTVATQLQLNSYPCKFLSRFYILHINIYNLHLLHETNCQNKPT